MKLRDIAERLQCRLEGDGEVDIVRVAACSTRKPGDLTFIANPRYLTELAATRASAVILGRAKAGDPPSPCAVLHTDDPYSAFARAVRCLRSTHRPAAGIDRLSAVADDASIGADVSIGAFVTIGAGATVGARTIIYPNVAIGPRRADRRGLRDPLAGFDSRARRHRQPRDAARRRRRRQRRVRVRAPERRHAS